MIHPIIQLFQDQSSLYRLKEIGDGTHDFTKRVLEGIFGLAPKSSLVPESNLFGESLYDNFYIYEGSKKQGASARWDFRCKINGQLVVVETERLDNIEAGMKQIGGYMKAENTNFGIVTDGGIWRFFKHGPDQLDIYETLTIDQLCSTDGQAFLQNFYNSYDFYLQRLSSVESKSFDTQIFHQGLITTAERVVFDLKSINLFTGETKEKEKEEIQTAYSLIIQILLIKIVQDKRKIDLLKKDVIIDKLKEQDRNGIFEAVEGQLKWLGDFYKPYHNQQDSLLNKIIAHYQQGSRIAKLNLDSVRLFLDLYHFIYSFDFFSAKQDLFGAVYENYLKELYKDDDTKKGQVFTPPEIVEFMLDEVGYTVNYIQGIIQDNLSLLKTNLEDHSYNIDGLSLIDPACGSGTFLYKSAGRIVHALHNIQKETKISDEEAGKIVELLICNNIVGFDIEPFPLYLAEMNILQWLLFFNVSADGTIINRIDTQIKIFSTDDSIAEFHNLELSMEKDLQDLINGGEITTLASKRNPKSILQLKADLQDFDREALMMKFQLELYHKALQNPSYIIDDGSLIKTKQKTYRDKHHKKITSLTTIRDLLAYVRETLDDKYLGLFEKNITALKPQLDHIRAKLSEIITKTQTKRTKFDFVVANPPYVNMKNTKHRGTILYGYDINNPEWKTIKTTGDYLNIYAYFYYLGIFLLKDAGKLCFITPRDLLFKTALHKTKMFLKSQSNIKKIIDFRNTAVFYNRGLNNNTIVGTTSVILEIQKEQIKGNTQIYEFNLEERFLDSGIFKDKPNLEKVGFSKKEVEYKDLFIDELDKGNILLIDYLHQTFADDLCISTYPKLWKNSDPTSLSHRGKINQNILIKYPRNENFRFLNKEKIGYRYFQNIKGYYINDNLRYYDFSELGTWIPYRTGDDVQNSIQGNNRDGDKKIRILNKQIRILNKQIRINRENGSYSSKKKYFGFSDKKEITGDQGSKSAIGIDKHENIGDMYFIFGILNSNHIQELIQERFGGIANQKNIEQLPIPILNTPAKLALKSDIITNSEAIITLCKQGNSGGPQTRGDICETVFDPDSLGEKITGLKAQYKSRLTSLSREDWVGLFVSDPLPDEILGLLKSETSDLVKLEQERDEIVKKLYELG